MTVDEYFKYIENVKINYKNNIQVKILSSILNTLFRTYPNLRIPLTSEPTPKNEQTRYIAHSGDDWHLHWGFTDHPEAYAYIKINSLGQLNYYFMVRNKNNVLDYYSSDDGEDDTDTWVDTLSARFIEKLKFWNNRE